MRGACVSIGCADRAQRRRRLHTRLRQHDVGERHGLAHVAVARRPREELAFVVAVVAGGFLVESLVVMQGHIVYPSGQPVAWLAPYWIVALWALLATAPNVTLRWLKRRPVLAAVLGAICGPASFLAGVRLGGARFVDATPALVTLAVTWAVLMPALMALSTRLDGYAALPASR